MWQFNAETTNYTYMQVAALPTLKQCRYFALHTFLLVQQWLTSVMDNQIVFCKSETTLLYII